MAAPDPFLFFLWKGEGVFGARPMRRHARIRFRTRFHGAVTRMTRPRAAAIVGDSHSTGHVISDSNYPNCPSLRQIHRTKYSPTTFFIFGRPLKLRTHFEGVTRFENIFALLIGDEVFVTIAIIFSLSKFLLCRMIETDSRDLHYFLNLIPSNCKEQWLVGSMKHWPYRNYRKQLETLIQMILKLVSPFLLLAFFISVCRDWPKIE